MDLLCHYVVGPVKNMFIGGSQYFETFMDDESGFSMGRFLRRKNLQLKQ